MLNGISNMDPDDRLPVLYVHSLLEGALALTQDPALGLKAAREISRGECGVVEYLARTAPTWGDGLRAVASYLGLLNDSLRCELRQDGDNALILLHSLAAMPRAAMDFCLGAFHIGGSSFSSPDFLPTFEVWFPYEEPSRLGEYVRTFRGAQLRFRAPWSGFVMPADYLGRRVSGGDLQLHCVLRKYAEQMLAALPQPKNMTTQLRELLATELGRRTITASIAAYKLSTSERSLARHLHKEGTSFTALLADTRLSLATRYLRNTELSMSAISLLLDFSDTTAFQRAFRRWTGQSPGAFRRRRR